MRVLRKRVHTQGDSKQNQSNGLYIHSSPPRVLQLSSAYIKQLIRTGDIDKLEQLVIDGQGKKFVGEYSADYKTRTFLKGVPNLMSKIALLHDAVNSGRLEELQSCLDEEPEKKKRLAMAKDDSGVGLLHKAVYYDLKDIYKYLIEKYPHIVSMKDAEGRTAYHYTPMCRDTAGIQKMLITAGADTSALDYKQHSPKYYANHVQELELPNSQKSIPHSKTNSASQESLNFKKSNIRIWIHQRNLANLQQVVWEGFGNKLLVEHSNNAKIKKFLEAVPHIMGLIKDMHVDVLNDDLDSLKNRLNPPIPAFVLSGKDANGLTPLHKAIGHGKQEMAEFIVERYPNSVGLADNEGRTPLHYAAIVKDDGKMTNFLLEHNADESALDNRQKTAAYYKTRASEIDAKVLNVIPDCPRTAKESYLSHFDWSLLTANAPMDEIKKVAKKIEDVVNGNETPKQNGDEPHHEEHEEEEQHKEPEEEAEEVEKTEEEAVNGEEETTHEDLTQAEDSTHADDTQADDTQADETQADETHAEETNDEGNETDAPAESEANETDEKDDEDKEQETDIETNVDETEHNEIAETEKEPDNTENEENNNQITLEVNNNINSRPHTAGKSRPPSHMVEEAINKLDAAVEEHPIAEPEKVIEGVVNGENEIEILNNDGHGGNHKPDEDEEDIVALVKAGNMEQLATLVLNGDGEKLIGRQTDNAELQSFLDNVPVYMSKINKIHVCARNGNLKELQAALDRRKFAIAKDKISPNGASPLHTAIVFGHTSIVRYLAGRFPETAQVTDDNGRTALHYAAVLPDNGHYFNLLVHLGADSRIEDKLGNSAEHYREYQSDFSHGTLLKDFGVEETATEEILNDKVPDDVYSARKDLDDEDMLNVLERCYNVLHGRRNSNTATSASSTITNTSAASALGSSPLSLISKHMRRYVFDTVKTRLTRLDHNLYDLIWPSVKKLPTDTSFRIALEQDFPAGIVVPDFYCYKVFGEFLEPIIKDYNSIGTELGVHPESKFTEFDDAEGGDQSDVEVSLDLDSHGKWINTDIVPCNGQPDMPFFATEEGRYLASSLGDPLIKGLTEVANKRPQDPIAYLATYLYNIANNRQNTHSRGKIQESQQTITGPPQAVDDNAAVPASIDVVTVEPEENVNDEESAFNSTSRDEHGQSMLHFAAARAHGRNALFQLLLETEINVAYRDELYRTARDISIQANLPENTSEIDRYVLHIATQGDTDKLVELLLDGYDHITDVVDEHEVPIVETVSKHNQPDTVAFLQSILAFEEKRERVHHAIRQGSINDVTTLLADENDTGSGKLLALGKNSYGRCSLHIGVLCQQEEIVDYLANTFPETLRLGDNLERTALHYAMGVEKMETISRVLIKAGAKRIVKDLKGRQPTYYFLNKSDITRLQEEEETF